MSTLDKVLIAVILVMTLTITLLFYWTMILHHKSYQRGLSYRTIEERCRAIVAATTGAWPHLESFLGEEFIKELEGKVTEMREVERMLSSEYMDNIGMTAQFKPVEVVRYLMARNTELARVNEAVTHWEMNQAAPCRTITIANRVVEALAVTDALNSIQGSGIKMANERMQKDFKQVISVCANYAPNMTFADSLPHYVEACLDFTRQKAHETGMAVAYESLKA